MAKPISFGFSSKPKTTSSISTPSTSNLGTPKPISLPSVPGPGRKIFGIGLSERKKLALRDDSEDEDEAPPAHEELTGFSSTGAILSKPREEKTERVIENLGNSDWRKRGKNLLPVEVQATRSGDGLVTVERDEVSKTFGLQLVEKKNKSDSQDARESATMARNGNEDIEEKPSKEMTDDERALVALLDDGTGKPKSTATIAVASNNAWQQRSEADDFRADVATRPESSTLDEYALMPVEEFGMAMLRGMGRKRRANGEIIDLNKNSEEEEKKRKERPGQQGLLGIGAKPVKGLEGVELGAWGKSDMRKNAKGEGFFTPVMIEDKRTGERITEEEFERRKKSAKKGTPAEDDWRERRDRNLDRSGRDKERLNGDDYSNRRTRKRERESASDDDHDSRPRHDRDQRRAKDDRQYEISRSRKDRSRSHDRRRDDHDVDDKSREKKHDRHHERYRDKDRDRYDSSESRRSDHRHRDRDRDKDRDDRRYRDRR